MATQIATGEANNIRIRVYGEKGGMEWRQMDPNRLILRWGDRPAEELYMGSNEYMSDLALWNTRIPSGHPEGFIEAFANVYAGVAADIRARLAGTKVDPLAADYPRVEDGARGVRFIERAVASAASEAKWTPW